MGKTKEQREAIMEYVIYCIYCKDEVIHDIYIGSTYDINTRMNSHKTSYKKKQQKIYKIIRANGGWENWEYTILETLECNAIEAEKREEYYRKDLEADMNSRKAFITQEELREKTKESNTKYYADNKNDPEYKEKNKERSKKWRDKNPDRVKENNKKRYENNQEEIKEKSKIWVMKNPEKVKEYKKKWNENNKFNKQRNETIRRLKKGISVRQSTLVKYNINRQDYINE